MQKQKNAKAIVFACFCIRTKVFFESKGDFTFLMQNNAKILGFGNKNAKAHVFDPKGCKSTKSGDFKFLMQMYAKTHFFDAKECKSNIFCMFLHQNTCFESVRGCFCIKEKCFCIILHVFASGTIAFASKTSIFACFCI